MITDPFGSVVPLQTYKAIIILHKSYREFLMHQQTKDKSAGGL